MFPDEVLIMEGGKRFEEECESYSVAIRAIWLLWRRGKKKLIKHTGLDWMEVNKRFSVFDLMYITHENGKLRTEEQTKHLVQFCSHTSDGSYDEFGKRLVQASIDTLALYQLVTRESRLHSDRRSTSSSNN